MGPPGASYVYYAWFITGVLGLNLSLYGLNAAEAGMLLSKTHDGRVPDVLRRHDKHVAGTWSGPGGWTKTAKRVMANLRDGPGRISWSPALPWRRWFYLALPSVLVFIALPLSGLSFEPESGFVRGPANVRDPNVTGFTYSSFNERHTGEVSTAAQVAWKNAIDARIPGMGIIYTRPGDDRLPPGALPKDSGVSQVFLTAQAGTPIHGTSWGLALQYNCSIIDKAADLTLLKRVKRNTTASEPRLALQPLFEVPGNIEGWYVNQTVGSKINMYGVIEYGLKEWPAPDMTAEVSEEDGRARLTETSGCYFNQHQNVTGDYHDADQESVLEMILWQYLMRVDGVYPWPTYNFTIDHNMTDLYGAYRLADNLVLLQGADGKTANSSVPMPAIGVRCSSSAAVGTATIDGVRSTFTDFTRTDTPIKFQINRCAPRLDARSISSVLSLNPHAAAATTATTTPDMLGDLFDSVAGPPAFYRYPAFRSEPLNERARLSYLQASDLRRSLLRAYAAYAVQLMYAGDKGFVSLSGGDAGATNPNVTAFVPRRVLKRGDLPVFVPMALLVAWMLSSVVLCGVFGFKPRWADTVDEGVRAFREGGVVPQEAAG